MYVGIEFFIGLVIGFFLYRRYFEKKLLTAVKNIETDHKRDEAMKLLAAMDEHQRILRLNGYSKPPRGWHCGMKTIDWSYERECEENRRKEQEDYTSV